MNLITGQLYVVCPGANSLVAYTKTTTSTSAPLLAWSQPFALGAGTWPPVFNGDDIMFLTTDKGLYQIELAFGTEATTVPLLATPPTLPAMWTQQRLVLPIANPGSEDRVLMYALDAAGDIRSNPVWETRLRSGEAPMGPLSAAGTLLVLPTSQRLLALTRQQGAGRWSYELQPPVEGGPYELLAHEALATSTVSLLQTVQYLAPVDDGADTTAATLASTPSSSTSTTTTTTNTNTATATTSTSTSTSTTTTTTSATTSKSTLLDSSMKRIRVLTIFRFLTTTESRFSLSWEETMEETRVVPANATAEALRTVLAPPLATITRGVLHFVSGSNPTAHVLGDAGSAFALADAAAFSPAAATVRALLTCEEIAPPQVRLRNHHVVTITSEQPQLQVTNFRGFDLDIVSSGQTVRLTGVPRSARLADLVPGNSYQFRTIARLETGVGIGRATDVAYVMPSAPAFPQAGRVLLSVSVSVGAESSEVGGSDEALADVIRGNYVLVQALRSLVCGRVPDGIASSTDCFVRSVTAGPAASPSSSSRRRSSSSSWGSSSSRLRRSESTAVIEIAAEADEANAAVVGAALLDGLAAITGASWLGDVAPSARVTDASTAAQAVTATTTTPQPVPTFPTMNTTTAEPSTTALDPGSEGSGSDNTTTIVVAVVCSVIGLIIIIVIVVTGYRSRQPSADKYPKGLFFENEGAPFSWRQNGMRIEG